ncbi:MAG: PEP-CTERM sorting domain-containing protein [Phycisphaerae bacterium]|nr:PEP-CTERM sorting domain-containing protein [Phycisphaerae bacterium]
MNRRVIFASALVGLLCLVGLPQGAIAEDVAPPSYRGQPGSTTQEWDFLTAGPSYSLPDGTSGITDNPYGNAVLSVENESGDATYKANTGPGPGGAWELWDTPVGTDYMHLYIPNTHNTGPGTYKDLRIQVTYSTNVIYEGIHYDAPPIIGNLAGGAGETCTFVGRSVVVLDPSWSVLVEDWRIEPNPLSESFRIWAGYEGGTLSLISEGIVDTVCVPEPATMSLLALGGLALLRHKRRHGG